MIRVWTLEKTPPEVLGGWVGATRFLRLGQEGGQGLWGHWISDLKQSLCQRGPLGRGEEIVARRGPGVSWPELSERKK